MEDVQDSQVDYRRRWVKITNQKGLHARAASKFVKLASQFDAQVIVVKKDTEVPGSSIMGLLLLAASPGSELEIRASGSEASRAIEALAQLVADKFHEE
ncbi:MAG: HPr family phosphocarrier protein [Pseudomonadota bacterium]